MNENETTAVINSPAPTGEQQPPESISTAIIPQQKLKFNGKDINSLEIIDGKTLLEKDLPPIRFIIDKILPQGLFILAGSPKIGKSWLSLDFCQTVATGGQIWDYKSEKGEVLYLALEDNLNRLQSRLKKYTSEGIPDLYFSIRALKLQEGLTVQVQDFMSQHPKTNLIIIDTAQHIRNNGNDKNAYVSDYHDMNILRELTNFYDIAIILVTHTRKLDDPDPLNTISGSTGLVGAVDGIFILDKDKRIGNKGRLIISHRDTEEHIFKLEFDKDNCRWTFIEEETAAESDTPFHVTINKFLQNNPDGWTGTATELCDKLAEIDENFSYQPLTIKKQIESEERILKKKYGIEYMPDRNKKVRTISLKKI